MKKASVAAASMLLANSGDAFGIKKPLPPPVPGQVMHAGVLTTQRLPQNVTRGEFQQLIDHANPALGTFSQRYWWSADYYGGPGSPVVFMTPGELNAYNYSGYASNLTITGLMAKAVRGAAVVLEHRYYGKSSPVTVLSTANLTHLTLANSMKDMTYFAKNVHLPFDPNRTSTPDKAPWIMSGSSYSGALVAWISRLDPGTFWAYHASSATVESISSLWHYWDPIRDAAMPRNCSADVVKVIQHVDQILSLGSDEEKQDFKHKFGMGSLADDDFASVLTLPLFSWQSTVFFADKIEFPDLSFTMFCDYVEGMWNGSGNSLPGAEGVGLERALDGFAKWSNDLLVDKNYCQAYFRYQDFAGPTNVSCFDSHNASNPVFTDLALNNTGNRQWTWLACNEAFEWFISAPPSGTPTIVSRLNTVDFMKRQCALTFPPGPNGETYGLAAGKSAETVNNMTGGWDDYWANSTRLIWTNGELDPWRTATVSSDQRPGGPLRSTAQVPVHVIPGGIHGSDMLTGNDQHSPQVHKVVDEEIAVIKGWVDDFYKAHGASIEAVT